MTESNEQGQPLGLASTAELSLVERLRQRQMVNWVDRPDPLCQEAAAELERMAVQINGLMFDALGEPRKRYVRVTLDGSHCIVDAAEGDRYVQEAREAGEDDADRYIVADVYLSEREFDDLPEFDGF